MKLTFICKTYFLGCFCTNLKISGANGTSLKEWKVRLKMLMLTLSTMAKRNVAVSEFWKPALPHRHTAHTVKSLTPLHIDFKYMDQNTFLIFAKYQFQLSFWDSLLTAAFSCFLKNYNSSIGHMTCYNLNLNWWQN